MGFSINSRTNNFSRLHSAIIKLAYDTKMYNGVPVLFAVLVCASVFLSCVAADAGWDDCGGIESYVESLLEIPSRACSFVGIMDKFYKLERDAELLCPDDSQVFWDLEDLELAIARCI